MKIGWTKPKEVSTDWDDAKIKVANFNSRALNALFQGRRFRTVSAGMASIFHTGLNIDRTKPVSTVPGYIPSFSQKLDIESEKKKKKKKVDLTHSNSEILLLTPIWDLFVLASHW